MGAVGTAHGIQGDLLVKDISDLTVEQFKDYLAKRRKDLLTVRKSDGKLVGGRPYFTSATVKRAMQRRRTK